MIFSAAISRRRQTVRHEFVVIGPRRAGLTVIGANQMNNCRGFEPLRLK